MRVLLAAALVVCACTRAFGGDGEMPPRLGVVATEKLQFDPDDPTFERYRKRLENAVRYEVEHGGLAEIVRYLSSTGYEALKTRSYWDVRLVLAEYQARTAPLPEKRDWTDSFQARLGTRRIPVPTPEDLVSPEDRLRGPAAVRNLRESELSRFTMTCDLAIVYPMAELLKKTPAGNAKEAAALCRERLVFLARLARHEGGSDLPVVHAAWTPDDRAPNVLEECRSRVQTDMLLGDPHGARESLARVEELIALNKAVIKDGVREALVSCHLTPMYWRDNRGNYVLCALFREFLFQRDGARILAIEALKKTAQVYRKLPKDSAERLEVYGRAEDIFNAFYECGARNEDIAEQALGKAHSDDSSWLDGER